MGASTSTEQVSPEQREAESLAASTGALPMLRNAFSALSDQQTRSIPVHTLQQCFGLTIDKQNFEESIAGKAVALLLTHVGPSIVDFYFVAEKGGVTWIDFLKGYTKCCGRASTSISFNNLFRIYDLSFVKAGLPSKLKFESLDADSKMHGLLLPADLLVLFWISWALSLDGRNFGSLKGNEASVLPDLNNLVLSAIIACTDIVADLNVWGGDILHHEAQIPAVKLYMWALKTIPTAPDCLAQFVHRRLSNSEHYKDKMDLSCSSSSVNSETNSSNILLTSGRAWSISLTLRNTMHEEILKACFPRYDSEAKENLLYKSSVHGKGLNRFWSNVEGYNGPLLLLIEAGSGDAKWLVGALTHQGFENKDTFYGVGGCLYTISPVFNVLSSSGKEKNFVYSHLHPAGRVYDPHPKPVGIGFGGSTGNERLFVDEDFSKVRVCHHAVDKTYLPGSLFPNQGFLPSEMPVSDVEVWGLGGKKAKDIQTSYKKRELLFTEQRRKVDLKTFSSWEDSPEKMMMDMVSDPNAVRREDR